MLFLRIASYAGRGVFRTQVYRFSKQEMHAPASLGALFCDPACLLIAPSFRVPGVKFSLAKDDQTFLAHSGASDRSHESGTKRSYERRQELGGRPLCTRTSQR